jgi:excinuclease ABC subunit A
MPENKRIMILSPVVRGKKGEHTNVLEKIRKEGFVRMRIDGEIYSIADEIELDPKKPHTIEIVVDRLVIKTSSPNKQSFRAEKK